MIKLFADYHTHTIYSHGRGTIFDNVMAAKAKGLTEIAITDHGLRHFRFGVSYEKIKKMRNEIDNINKNVEGIKVLLGMECNIISTEGDIDITDEAMKYLDILLVGYHMMVLPKGLTDAFSIYGNNYSLKFLGLNRDRIVRANTETMIKALKKNDIDILTHPGARIPVDTTEVSKVAVKTNTAMEINSHKSFMQCEHVKEAAKTGVKFVINSDAHTPEDVGNFKLGLKIANEAELNSTQIINAIQ